MQNSPEHWRQNNWHEKHMAFHKVSTAPCACFKHTDILVKFEGCRLVSFCILFALIGQLGREEEHCLVLN